MKADSDANHLGVRDATLLFVADGMAFARIAKMTICIIRSPPTVHCLELVRRETARTRVGDPNGWIGFTACEATAIVSPPEEVREASAALMRDLPATMVATIIEGRGFKNVAARAILHGMHMLSRSKSVPKVFSDVPTAASWVIANCAAAGAPQGTLTHAELCRAVEATRARL